MFDYRVKKTMTVCGLVCLMAASASALAAAPDSPQAASAVDRNAVAAQILGDWAGFPVPVDTQNNTPWGPIDLAGWVKTATVEQLLAASTATTFDGVVSALRSAVAKSPGAVVLAAGQPISASALGSLTDNLVYTPVTPCRIIDTRSTALGILAANTGRQFGISSANYSAQGGVATTCGIPLNATAVAINVVSTGQTGLGNLKVVESYGGVPNAAFLNYQPGVNTANAGISKVASVSSTIGLYIHSSNSASHAVVDIMGYFSALPIEHAITALSFGALNLAAASQTICKTGSFTPTRNGTARLVGNVSLQADATGSLGWSANTAYSTDAGTTWPVVATGYNVRGGAPASTWGGVSVHPLETVALTAGTAYMFGVYVARDGGTGTGNANDSRCMIRVDVEY